MWHERGTVVGVFASPDAAGQAIDELRQQGFRPEDVGLLTSGQPVSHFLAEPAPTESTEGALYGLIGGGLLGGLIGWLAGLTAVAIPGAAPLVVAGPLAGLLAGTAVGVGAGGIFGALTGLGVPEDEASWYERRVREGATLVAVQAGNRGDEVRDVLRRHGAEEVRDEAELHAPEPAFGDTAGGMLAAHRPHPLRVHEAEPGWLVYSADERRIGVVEEVADQWLAIRAEPERLFIPLREVSRVEDHSIYLSRNFRDIPRQTWSSPPAPRPAAPGLDAECAQP